MTKQSIKIQKLQFDGMLVIAASPLGSSQLRMIGILSARAENKKPLLNQEGLWDGLELLLNGRRRRTPS